MSNVVEEGESLKLKFIIKGKDVGIDPKSKAYWASLEEQ
jgi:hypothetical protein